MDIIPLQKLHVRLLKEEVRAIDDVFEKNVRLTPYKLKSGLGFSGTLHIAVPNQNVPRWFEFVETGVDGDLRQLINKTNAAVLAIKVAGRFFIFTFGHGRYLIKQSAFVSDFGIKAALNGLKHDSLRSLDTYTVEEQTIHKRTQASRSSGIGAFGLDIGRDILRSVTGMPRAELPEYLQALSGNESVLALSVRVDFPSLKTLCEDLLILYRKRVYKANFSWVDNIGRVADSEVVDILDQRLVENLRLGDKSKAYVAPPEPVDWMEVTGFSYSGRRDLNDSDMNLASYISGNEDLQSLSIEKVHHDKVYMYSDDERTAFKDWSVYKCLVFETEYQDKRFILTNGDWFQIDKDFAAEVLKDAGSIPMSTRQFPAVARKKDGKLEAEGDYNKRVGSITKKMAVLDCKNVKCQGAHSSIEPCDLLSDAGEFIFVKHRKGGSSSLSHLFSQARVSADSFLGDEHFRRGIRLHLRGMNLSWEKWIPISRPNSANYNIVLTFLGVNQKTFVNDLPFFSQLNLARTAQMLRSRGFEVTVAGVPVQN